MWDLPGPGLEPVSPALAGGFLTTVPPEKSRMAILNNIGDGMYMIDKREEGMKDEIPSVRSVQMCVWKCC